MAIKDERYRILAAVRGSYWSEVQRLSYVNSSRREEIVASRDIAVSAAERVLAAFGRLEEYSGFIPVVMHGLTGTLQHIEKGMQIALEKMGVDSLHNVLGESGISLRALIENVDLFPEPQILQGKLEISRRFPIANTTIQLVVATGQNNKPVLGFYRG